MKEMYFVDSNKKPNSQSFKKRAIRFVTDKMMSIAPKSTTRLAERLLCTVSRGNPDLAMPPYFEQEDFSVGDEIIRVYTSPGTSDRVLLFLHGWGGRAEDFLSIYETLRPTGVGFVAFDQVGHGRSSGRITNFFSFVFTARNLVDHIESKGLKVVGVVAHSMGASTSLAIPQLLKKHIPFVLIAPVLPFFESLYASVDQFGFSTKWLSVLINQFSKKFQISIEEIEPKRTFSALTGPLLYLHDQQDRFVPYDANLPLVPEKFCEQIIATSGLGHFRILKDHEVGQKILKFLKQTKLAPLPVDH